MSSPTPTDDEHCFADKLAALLASRGATQQTLADRVGVTRASVNDWCRGRATPPPETVFAIERALEVTPGELSRTVGYLPLETEEGPPATVRDCITRAPELDDTARRLLLVLYDELASS